jgi:branched-chain amino acid transport system substrate-binding protein
MKKTMKTRHLGVLVLVFALVAVACGDDDAATTTGATTAATTADVFTPGALGAVDIAPGDAVEIRALQAISGDVEFLGTDQVRGIELAIEDYGDINGHSVNLGTVEDDLCSAEGGQAGAQAILAQEGVLGVVGTTCSGAAAAASPLLSAKGMVLVSGSNTSPSLSSDLAGTAGENYHPGYYRTAHNDLFQGATAAQFAFEELGLTKAAAIHDGDPYTDGLATAFADAFVELGGEVVVYTAVNKGDTDMTAVLTEVSAGGPEIVFFPIFPPEGDFVIQQAGGVAGLEDVIWFGADGILVDSFMSLPESEGMYFSGPDLRFGTNQGVTGVTYDELVARYEVDYGEAPPAPFHAHTYDAAMMLMSAIEAVAVVDADGTMHVDRQALRDELDATSGFSGVTGTLECDAFGDCGAQAISIIQHLDSGDLAASKANVVYSFSPTG